jgi:hypothetical protein
VAKGEEERSRGKKFEVKDVVRMKEADRNRKEVKKRTEMQRDDVLKN